MWTLTRFQSEMQKFDSLLRARISKLDPSIVIIERKCRRESLCVPTPNERRGMDKWICDTQGYVQVSKIYRHQMNRLTLLELRAQDMWEYRGAGYFADMLEVQEAAEEERKRKEESDMLHFLGEEAYDRGMIKQGDIVSNFRSKVGG